MATLFEMPGDGDAELLQHERRFYMGMSIALAATVLAGFTGYIALGISNFAAPWWVHVHAVTYMGWIALYVVQNLLIVRGNFAQHRLLGMMMSAWAAWMVVVGYAVLVLSLGANRSPPPVFTAPFLLAMDGINIAVFFALVCLGLALRSKPDWHKRIMLSATVSIIAPGLGRLTVFALGGFSWRNVVLIELGFIAVAMAFDRIRRGRVHPALVVGALAIAAMGLVVPPASDLPAIVKFAQVLHPQ